MGMVDPEEATYKRRGAPSRNEAGGGNDYNSNLNDRLKRIIKRIKKLDDVSQNSALEIMEAIVLKKRRHEKSQSLVDDERLGKKLRKEYGSTEYNVETPNLEYEGYLRTQIEDDSRINYRWRNGLSSSSTRIPYFFRPPPSKMKNTTPVVPGVPSTVPTAQKEPPPPPPSRLQSAPMAPMAKSRRSPPRKPTNHGSSSAQATSQSSSSAQGPVPPTIQVVPPSTAASSAPAADPSVFCQVSKPVVKKSSAARPPPSSLAGATSSQRAPAGGAQESTSPPPPESHDCSVSIDSESEGSEYDPLQEGSTVAPTTGAGAHPPNPNPNSRSSNSVDAAAVVAAAELMFSESTSGGTEAPTIHPVLHAQIVDPKTVPQEEIITARIIRGPNGAPVGGAPTVAAPAPTPAVAAAPIAGDNNTAGEPKATSPHLSISSDHSTTEEDGEGFEEDEEAAWSNLLMAEGGDDLNGLLNESDEEKDKDSTKDNTDELWEDLLDDLDVTKNGALGSGISEHSIAGISEAQTAGTMSASKEKKSSMDPAEIRKEKKATMNAFI